MRLNYVSSHIHYLLDRKERLPHLRRSAELLEPYRDEFDTVVMTGVSGLLSGPWIADHFDKEMIVVRKPSDTTNTASGYGTHSPYAVEGWVQVKRYIIVDDFISTGRTVCRIFGAVDDFIKRETRYDPPICFGVLETSSMHFTSMLIRAGDCAPTLWEKWKSERPTGAKS